MLLKALEQKLLDYDKICGKSLASKPGGLKRERKGGMENRELGTENYRQGGGQVRFRR
jgi:hypothetical protein